MIEDCGLKGFRSAAPRSRPSTGNFIVNTGGATAADVAAVIKRIYEEVREVYGIELQPEVKFLGF